MRSLLAFVLGVCAVLAALVAVPSLWVSHNIADQEGYVAFAEPIARDGQLAPALSKSLASTLLDNVPLSEFVRPLAEEAITGVVSTLTDQPGFVAAWNETQARSHQISFGDPRDLRPELDASNRFAVDLAPLGKFVIDQVNRFLPFSISAPEQVIVAVNGNSQTQTIQRIRESPVYARNALIVLSLAAGMSLFVARRTSIAVLWLGLAAIALAGLLKLGAAVVVPEVLDRNTAPTPLGQAFLDAYVDRANESFGGWLVTIAIGGAVVAVVGAVWRGASSVRSRG